MTLYSGDRVTTLPTEDNGSDLIYGNLGNDTIFGGSGNNTVYGGQGDDLIVVNGGPNNSDHLFGNLGADTFDFTGDFGGQDFRVTLEGDYLINFFHSTGETSTSFALIKHRPLVRDLYTEVQGNSSVTSVETATNFALSHNSAGMAGGTMFGDKPGQGNVVFVAGVTDGYLIFDQDGNGSITPNTTDFAIVLENLNNTSLFRPESVIAV